MKRIVLVSLVVLLFLTACTTETTVEDTATTGTTVATVCTVPTVATAPTVTTEPVETTEEVTEPQYEIIIHEDEAVALAQMAWGEARGCSDMETAATMWCVLNRVDAWSGTVIGVVTAPYQFHGYSPKHPVEDRLYNLAVDVLTRWQMEKQGASPEEVGRVLPPQYLYFYGDGRRNHFKDKYEYEKSTIWDWSYPNPYETE